METLFTAVYLPGWFQEVLGRLSINCFGLPTTATQADHAAKSGSGDPVDDEHVGTGLFVAASFVNHACGA